MSDLSSVIFVGLAEACTTRNVFDPVLPIYIRGLRQAVQHIVYPALLNQWCLLLLVRRDLRGEFAIGIVHPDRQKRVDITFNLHDEGDGADLTPDWVLIPCTVSTRTPLLISEPSVYEVQLARAGVTTTIGKLNFLYAPAPSLTPDEVQAIRARPNAPKCIRYRLECSSCGDAIVPIAGIDPSRSVTPPYIWYSDLPDTFTCGCGTFMVPLRYLRESMHGLLRTNVSLGQQGQIQEDEALYTEEASERTFLDFQRLLDAAPN